MTQPAVSKHLKVLERAGLIARSRHAQWRPCRLEARPLRDAAAWVEQYRRFWEERFQRLDAYLEELKNKEGTDVRSQADPPQQERAALGHGSSGRTQGGSRHASIRRSPR
jgi:DNA-binding MarR family transcriptional regulator